MFIQVSASAQNNIKKVLVEGDGQPIVMLAGGTADNSAFAREVSIQSGHTIPITAPKELVKDLLEFLK